LQEEGIRLIKKEARQVGLLADLVRINDDGIIVKIMKNVFLWKTDVNFRKGFMAIYIVIFSYFI